MKLTEQEALDMGFTHHGSYYGLPVYLGNLEFCSKEPIEVVVVYQYTDWVFTFLSFIEWLFTPPNAGSMFMVGPELQKGGPRANT